MICAIYIYTFGNICRLVPSWERWIYCQGLMLENVTYEMSYLWQAIEKIPETIYLRQLRQWDKQEELSKLSICSRHSDNTDKFLYSFKHNRNITKNVLIVTNLFDMFGKHSNNVASLTIIITEIKAGKLG